MLFRSTLASDRSWNLTHRLIGRLWVLFGLLLVVLAILDLGGGVMAATLVGGIVLTLVGGLIYKEPDLGTLVVSFRWLQSSAGIFFGT